LRCTLIVSLTIGLVAATLAFVSTCRAEENTGAALYRKCEIYLAGVNGKHLSAAQANDAGDCSGFIDAAVAAARLAHARHGLLLRGEEPPGNVDKTAYQSFAFGVLLGADICLPDSIAPREVAARLYRWGRLDSELLYAGELSLLHFVLIQSYPCQ
jgi:hypothetical protein